MYSTVMFIFSKVATDNEGRLHNGLPPSSLRAEWAAQLFNRPSNKTGLEEGSNTYALMNVTATLLHKSIV